MQVKQWPKQVTTPGRLNLYHHGQLTTADDWVKLTAALELAEKGLYPSIQSTNK